MDETETPIASEELHLAAEPTAFGPTAIDASSADQAGEEAPATEIVQAGNKTDDVAETTFARPSSLPEKFWDDEAGEVRLDAMIKSYCELEKRLSGGLQLDVDQLDDDTRTKVQRLMGVPESADEYTIETTSEWVDIDAGLNERLHGAGFSQEQAQLVYDLAGDYLLPAIGDAVSELQASFDQQRLEQDYGGEDRWRQLSGQLKTWGEANLDADVFATLSTSYEGVRAMHSMMQASEPAILDSDAVDQGVADEANLRQMMRDPRYWRDRDPDFIAQVTTGFKRLYRG
ncbi:MAG: hypothetical protein ACFB6S_06550 [Geminicoccaceae bacterium]